MTVTSYIPILSGVAECNSNNIMDNQDNNLHKELAAHNEYFKQMINLVPADFYFNLESKEKINEQKSALLEALSNKGSRKRVHGRELSERAQKKRMKYDPTLSNTVIDIQEALIQQEEREKELEQKGKKKKNNSDDDDSSLKSAAESLDELHEKLQQKIEALREKRGAMGKGNTPLKKKEKKKERKMKTKMKQKSTKIKGQTPDVTDPVKGSSTPFKSPSKPIFNKEGKMVFSKFDFSESPSEKKEAESMPSGSKKYKKLLEQVEQRKHKLQQLKESDAEEARSVEEKMLWQNAIKKAEGTKVRDNPELLKKTMKRIEKRKQKSHKEWQERNERVQQKMQDKQDKRKKHIQAKKQAKVDKKIKKAKKKGRVVPGF